MKRLSKILAGLLFVLSVAVIGFVLGAYIGGSCCVPAGSGLAGGAIVLGYGVIGAIIAALAAVVVARYLPAEKLVAITLVTAVVGGVLGGVILKIYLDSRAETEAFMQDAYANMLKFRVELVPHEENPARPFEKISFDWGAQVFTATVDGRSCTVPIAGEDGALMLGALRDVEGVVYNDPFPCAGTLGEARQTLDMYIPEATGQPSVAQLALTAACLEDYPALGKPMAVAIDIFKRSDLPPDCR